jgi:drug/metabolite transporter (DMT)-like permease
MLLIPETRRRWRRIYIPAALAYAATLLLFVLANKQTTSANAIFLQSTAPLYLMFISPFILRESLRRSDVILIIVIGLGLSLFFVASEPAAITAPDPFTGNLLAAAAGFTWALTVASLRAVSRGDASGYAGIRTVVIGNCIAFAAALPMAMPLPQITAADLATITYLGIFQVGLAYVFLTRGVAHVPAFEAAALLLLEPAINPVWTWLLLGETPASLALAGGVLILAATLGNTWWQSRGASA